ncbi:hypothetical protein [Yersinia aldovae]|uniref:hypothetical protein n=1 Tax=Yersinia aldovae TaxID=29483 RepID=UPI0009E2C76C
MADIARTQGKIAEEKALKDPQAIQAAKDALAQSGNLTPTEKQLNNSVAAMAQYCVTRPCWGHWRVSMSVTTRLSIPPATLSSKARG